MSIYNDKNTMGLQSTVFVQLLPDRIKDMVAIRVQMALNHLEFKSEALTKERAFDDAMNSRLVDLVDLIGKDDISEIMDEWAIAETFDPERVVTPQAAWITVDDMGEQLVFEVHLMPCEISPVGVAWKIQLFEFNREQECWDVVARGVELHCNNAYEVKLFDTYKYSCRRMPVEWLEEHGIGAYEQALHGKLVAQERVESLEPMERSTNESKRTVWATDRPMMPTYEKLMQHPSPYFDYEWIAKAGEFNIILDIDNTIPGDVDCVVHVENARREEVFDAMVKGARSEKDAYEQCAAAVVNCQKLNIRPCEVKKASTWLFPHPEEFKPFEALGKEGFLWSDSESPAVAVAAINRDDGVWSLEMTSPAGEKKLSYGETFSEAYEANLKLFAFNPKLTGINNPKSPDSPYANVSELKKACGGNVPEPKRESWKPPQQHHQGGSGPDAAPSPVRKPRRM